MRTKTPLVIMVSALFIVLAGCKENEDLNISAGGIQGRWTIDKIQNERRGEWAYNETEHFNEDDYYEFRNDGKVVIMMDGDREIGVWELNEKSLRIDLGWGDDDTYEVVKLTKRELQFRYEDNVFTEIYYLKR